ncbi:MAG: thiamine-phosphate kinase [Endomicrobium sp.]|jgi:thiamine-monophosphate kinase|nr:thiamine-phosphate kinase [Endomicrobium sp.]
MKKKYISSIDEFKLIDMIKNDFTKLNLKNDNNIIVNIGDDCFCFKIGQKKIFITKDMLIENVHFKKNWIDPQDLGKKAVEVNISDIAAMGNVKPKYIFIGLGIPPTTSKIFIKKLYKGLKMTCDKYNMVIAGGDTVRADKIIISITTIGIGKTNKIIRRNNARVGDLIGLTNTFGDAGAGVDLLYKYGPKHKYNKYERFLISKQNNPKAKFNESIMISKHLTSLIDASDGFYVSVNLLAKNSNKGADIYIEKIPISLSLKKVIKNKSEQIKYALFGAEDYELIFTVSTLKAKLIKEILPSISYVGRINLSKKVKYFYNGKEKKVKYSGYRHF